MKVILTILIGVSVLGAGLLLVLSNAVPDPDPIEVMVMVPPHQYFVDRIGGRYVSSSSLLDSFQNPLEFTPGDEHLERILHSDIVFLAGFDWETDIIRALEQARIQNARGNPEILSLANIDSVDLSKSSPFLWMNPKLAEKQAEIVSGSIQDTLPDHAVYFQKRYRNLADDITEIDHSLGGQRDHYRDPNDPVHGNAFKLVVVCPMFDHLASAIDHVQKCLYCYGDSISDSEAEEINGGDYVAVIFVQPQCSMKSALSFTKYMANRIPLAEMDALKYDYCKNMWSIREKLRLRSSPGRWDTGKLWEIDLEKIDTRGEVEECAE